jgi:fatty-acyl-CoA synthase
MTNRARTLFEMLAALRSSPAKVVFPGRTVLPHCELPARADRVASALRTAQVKPGDVVGLIVPTSPEWLAAFFGTIQAGAAVTALPMPPISVNPAAVARQMHPIAAAARLRHIVAGGAGLKIAEELAALCPGLVVVDVAKAAVAAVAVDGSFAPPDQHSLAIVQFSSGSTSRPKGVMLTHEAVITGVSGINSHILTQPTDVLVQWVPLFHDMGLIALLCALYTPNDAHLFSPLEFMRDPGAILTYIAEVGGSIVTGPNFSYEKIVEGVHKICWPERVGPEGPLTRWRLALNGAEMVRAQTVTSFQESLQPLGVQDSTMYPCYGMAEATLAITLPRLGRPPRSVTIDRRAIDPGEPVRRVSPNSPDGRTLMSVGVPIPGMSVRITDLDGHSLPEGFLGEVLIQGTAVTTGYLHDEPATRAAMREGWLRTGDLGFWDSGELFIAGRLKEMIVVRGKNFFPDDIEEAVRSVPGIFRQHCLALADPAEERVIIVAETSITSPPGESLRDSPAQQLQNKIYSVASSSAGLSAIDVILVPPRSLPRTTSGKWQRNMIAKLAAARCISGQEC